MMPRVMNCNNMFYDQLFLAVTNVLLTFQRVLIVILVKICAAGVEIPIGRFTKVRENSSIEKTNRSH